MISARATIVFNSPLTPERFVSDKLNEVEWSFEVKITYLHSNETFKIEGEGDGYFFLVENMEGAKIAAIKLNDPFTVEIFSGRNVRMIYDLITGIIPRELYKTIITIIFPQDKSSGEK